MSYKISDALKILGLGEKGRDRLFYWIKHKDLNIELEEEAKGRGKRSSLSLENIFELAVVKELANWGIDLSTIGNFLKAGPTFKTFKSENGKLKQIKDKHFARFLESVCYSYRKEAGKHRDFIVLIHKDENDNSRFLPIGSFYFIEDLIKDEKFDFGDSILILDLYKILRNIEVKTGEKV